MKKHRSEGRRTRRNSSSRRRSLGALDAWPIDQSSFGMFLESEKKESSDDDFDDDKSCELTLRSVRHPSLKSGPMEAYWSAETDPFKGRKVPKRHSIAGNSPISQKKNAIKSLTVVTSAATTANFGTLSTPAPQASSAFTSAVFRPANNATTVDQDNQENVINQAKHKALVEDVTINKKRFGYIQTKPAVRRLSNTQKANLYKNRPDLSPFYESNNSVHFTFDATDTDSSGDESITSSSRSSVVVNTARLRPRRSTISGMHTNKQDMWIGAIWTEKLGPNP